MSLAEAVALIADEMDAEAKELGVDHADVGKSYCSMSLRGYARQLRIAVKASSGDKSTSLFTNDPTTAAAQNYSMIEQAKIKLREEKAKTNVQEADSSFAQMTEVRGGPAGGTMTPVDPTMPVNEGRMLLAGGVYVLRASGSQRWLEYDEVAIKKATNDKI